MNRRVDRINRALLSLLGLVLLAAGGGGAAIGLGVLRPWPTSGPTPVWSQAAKDWVVEQRLWFWPTLIGLSVVLGILGLTWLVAQFRTDTVARLELEPDTSGGGTTLIGRAVSDAVGAEIAGYPGVRRAHVRLVGRPSRPRLLVRVETEPETNLGQLRERVENEAVGHVRGALETEVPVTIEFAVAASEYRRALA